MGDKMKTKTLSLSTILGFLGLLLMIHSMKAHSSSTNINCSTAFGVQKFTITEGNISFKKEDPSGVNRSISSIENSSIRTQKNQAGFTKTLYIEGNKYFIKIQNINHFSELDDYLAITSSRGHVMTYPLTCQLV
jgi:hypothetical protein